MSQFFASGSQSTGVSASASVLPGLKSGLISFKIDWFDLAEINIYLGTFASLLHNR